MKIPRFEMTANRFYAIGKYVFFVNACISLIRLLDVWKSLKSYDVFSSIAGTTFQIALWLFFAHLQGKANIVEADDGDIFKMNEALEKLDLVKKKNGKETRH